MAVVGTAEVLLRVSTTGLDKQIEAQVNSALKTAERSGQKLTQVNDQHAKSTGTLGRALGDLKGRLHSVAEEGGPVSRELANVATKVLALSGPLAVVGVGVAVLTGVLAIGTEAFLKLAEQVHKFQLLSGASAEDASRFVVALRLLGVEPDRIAGGLFRMGRQISDGTSKLNGMEGVISRTKTGGVDLVDTFLNVADAVKQASGDGDKASIAFAAFGRQGLTLLPILERGRGELEKLFAETPNSEILHQQDIDRAIDLNIKIKDLHENVNALKVEAGKKGFSLVDFAVGTGTGAVKGLNAIVDGTVNTLGKVSGGFAKSGAAADLFINAVAPGVPLLHRMGSATAEVSHELQVAAAKLELFGTEAKDLQSAVFGVLDAQQGLNQSALAETSANLSLVSAKRDLARLYKEGRVDARAVQSAQDSLTSSTKSLRDAYDNLAEAERDFQKVQEGATPRDLEHANLKVSEANVGITRATENLNRVMREHRHSTTDVTEAQNQLAEANLAAAEAQDDLGVLQAKGTADSPDYIDAQKKVADAQDNVTTATHQQDAAAAALREAQRGDPDFDDKVAQAKQGVALAESAVTGAKLAHIEAAEKLAAAVDNETDAWGRDADGVGLFRDQLNGLVNDYNINIKPVLDALGNFGLDGEQGGASKTIPGAKVIIDGTPALPGVTTKKRSASGNPMAAGEWSRVNENGTEWFRANSSGTILPIGNPATPSGHPSVNQQINVYESGSPSTTAQLVNLYTGRALRTAGR